MASSRRNVLAAAGLFSLGAAKPIAAAAIPKVHDADLAWLQAILEHYDGFGLKASGGAGDNACGEWLQGELERLGYVCRRQAFDVPYFEPSSSTLTSGAAQAPVIPQAIVAPTGPSGLTASLRLASSDNDMSGSIAIIDLPFKRWVSLADPEVAEPLGRAFQQGAMAVVLITNGPTRDAIALNASIHRPGYGKPVAILAPKHAKPFLDAAKEKATGALTVAGEGGRRSAFNLLARIDRGAAKDLILSTPRSGWFGCAAERGSGLAVWLSLARWLSQSHHNVNIELLATSGHEYEYLGGEHYLELAPKPDRTRLWTHIGASAAARDWHELGLTLRPLPNADSQRILTATPDIIEQIRPLFHGISGLEASYVADHRMAGGELVNVLNAGYKTTIGLYGGHRYFHTADDDLRCVSADLVEPVARAFRSALQACLQA